MRMRRRIVLGLVALALTSVAMPPARAASPVVRARPAVTVLSFNACGAACRHGEIGQTARGIVTTALREDAAVVLLQELCQGQYDRVHAELAGHGFTGRFAPAAHAHACGGGFGVAILVRGAVGEAVTLPLPTNPRYERRALLGVTTTLGGRRTFVATVHLSPSPAAGLDD